MLLRPHFCVLLNDVITKRVKNKSNTFGSTFFLLDELEHQELFSSLFDGWRNTRWTARLFAIFSPRIFPPQPNNLPRLKCTILGRNYKQSSRACEWSEMGEFTRQAVKVHFIPDYINCITVTTYPWENLCRLYIETYALPSCFINL